MRVMFLALGLAALVITPGRAGLKADRETCVGIRKSAGAEQIRACTRLLDRPWRPSQRALIYIYRGDAHRTLKQFQQAVTDYTTAISLSRVFAGLALRGRGYAYLKRGMHKLAIDDFTQVIRTKPDDSRGYVGRADVYLALNQRNKAIADIRAAYRLSPYDKDVVARMRTLGIQP